MTSPSLDGFTVGVTADRRGDEQALMLRRLGADVAMGPAIRTLPLADDHALLALTKSLIADPPDFLIANTGLGMRSWLGLAATWGLDRSLCQALAGTRIAARGPKAAAALAIGGLEVWWQAETEQLSSVAERLLGEPLAGAKVALQLHGDDRQPVTRLLGEAGAEVIEVLVYRWTLPTDPAPALRLVELCCTGGVDAVTFTSGPAVRNFVALARASGRGEELVEALNGEVMVACVGPICAAVALEEGLAQPMFPDQWRLGSLVRLVADGLAGHRRQYRVGRHTLVLAGSAAQVDGRESRLTLRERAVLRRLAAQRGGTVSRAELLRDVWKDPHVDPHVLETVVGRLRAKLGPAAEAVETTVRRGYRFSAPEVPWGPEAGGA